MDYKFELTHLHPTLQKIKIRSNKILPTSKIYTPMINQEIKIFHDYLSNKSLLEDEIRKFTNLAHIHVVQIHAPVINVDEGVFPQIIIMITFENHA